MKRRRKSWLKDIFQWFIQKPRRFVNKPNSIFQSIFGDRNQTIGSMSGGIAIANVEKLIQNFNLQPHEVLALQDFWKNWSNDTKPALTSSLVIGGRYKERDRILEWLKGVPSPLTLQGDSPEEAIAFLAAVIQDLEKEERDKFLTRAVIVNGATSWQNIITCDKPLILIARLKEIDGIGTAIGKGHHVFVPSERVSSGSDHLLPRIVRDAAEQALKEMGFNYEQGGRYATLARRSLLALRRKLAIASATQQPAWAKSENARILLTPLLVSAWDDSSDGDRIVLSKLANMPYENLQNHLVRWVNESDPPLRRVGGIWAIASQEDAWLLLARYLTDDDLKRFEDVVLEVLSEINPALELPPDQRFAASVFGKVSSYSSYLVKGICEMLALMAALSSNINFIANKTGQDVADRIVWQLMEKANNNVNLWASLSYQLPLLAEAAPGIVLDAIDLGLTGENPILLSLFEDQTANGFSSTSSSHVGLLWALETLAWNPEYLCQAALNIARLTRLDPGGTLGNRPAQSLRDIFVCWHPNTTASLESCLRVIDTIRSKEPKVAWNLMMSLLPKLHGSVSPTHGTKWRDWTPDSRTPINQQEYLETTTEVLKRLIADAEQNATRICNLIISIRGLTVVQLEILIDRLETLEPKDFSTEDRIRLCDRLRGEIVSHRQYHDAAWAISDEYVQRLEAVLNRFEPDNLVYKHIWLFKHGVPLQEKLDLAMQDLAKIVEGLRTDALNAVLISLGWDGVMQLAQQADEPSLVGSILAKAGLLPIDLDVFLRKNFWSEEKWREEMAREYVIVCAYRQGEGWIKNCIDSYRHTWNEEEYGKILVNLPFGSYLLDILDRGTAKTQSYFWSRVQRIAFLDAERAEYILTNLLKFDRPHLALQAIEFNLKDNPRLFSNKQIAEVLEASVKVEPKADFSWSSFAYQSANLMKHLAKTEISPTRLAKLELSYFRIHDHYRRPELIYTELAQDPKLFIEILKGSESYDSLGRTLLREWKTLPGLTEDNSADEEHLASWVTEVRKLALKNDLEKLADVFIGRLFAFSPIDPDGAFPHQAVRNIIEELANSTIEDCWYCQILNNRGVTTRSLTAGGDLERTLEKQYKEYAELTRDRWSRTANVLRKIAERYHQKALSEDVRAELTQDFW